MYCEFRVAKFAVLVYLRSCPVPMVCDTVGGNYESHIHKGGIREEEAIIQISGSWLFSGGTYGIITDQCMLHNTGRRGAR